MPEEREGLNTRRFLPVFICFSLVILSFVFVLASRHFAIAQGEDEETDIVNVKRDGRQIQARIPKEVPDPDSGRASASGSILVKFRSNVNEAKRDQIHRNVGALKVGRLYLGNTHRVRVPQAALAADLAAYRANPSVEYAVPDRIVRALGTPNDPSFNQQWGMSKINAPGAWDISTSSAAARVAILDCGVYDSASTFVGPDGKRGHPDVRDKVVARINFTTSRDADDWCDHGTHVSGIAGAVTNNGIGVSGLGYSNSIVNVKVLGDNGSGTFGWVINGILWAAGCDTNPCGARRAEIINMSLGATGACDPLVQAAMDKAWAQGMVIVAAAGNDSASGAITPANCSNVIAVSASDTNDAKASFSNFGNGVDVAAPGVNILSTNFVGKYASFSGTSMASPHVAGEAALIWTTSYNTSNQAVVDRILSTANLSALAGSNFGRIDAFAAVGGSGIPLPSPSPSPTPLPSPSPSPSPTPLPSPSPSPSPVPISCDAPVIISHSDTRPTSGGTVSFAWNPVAGVTLYRVQRQRTDGTWNTRTTSSSTSFTGSDVLNDPNWRVFISAGTCTPIPGPDVVFDP
ncbi:S8 family serine peptidase [Candidatus Curtissbacteria bacterium]|nr:S8 family serine peptidase [Candidatus Curtissbacteria bacterium]